MYIIVLCIRMRVFIILTIIGPKAPVMAMAEVDFVNGQFEIIVSWKVCR